MRERGTGAWVAIQRKFYDPAPQLRKEQTGSFCTAAGLADFSYGMIVSTRDNWAKHAEDSPRDQSNPVTRLCFQDLADSVADWSTFNLDQPAEVERKDNKRPCPHQRISSGLDDEKEHDEVFGRRRRQ